MITDDMSDIFKRLMHADDVNLSVFLTAGYPNMTACGHLIELLARHPACLLYTSDAADEV